MIQPTSPIKRRVLLVEDHPAIVIMMEHMLALLGHQVITGVTLAQAVAQESGTYDVVLCDYRLPDGAAPELRDILKQRAVQVPIILLTAYDKWSLSPGDMQGFDAILTKPVEMEQLRIALDSGLTPVS